METKSMILENKRRKIKGEAEYKTLAEFRAAQKAEEDKAEAEQSTPHSKIDPSKDALLTEAGAILVDFSSSSKNRAKRKSPILILLQPHSIARHCRAYFLYGSPLMKCISFNTNSIRIRLHQLEETIRVHAPDVIGIQETKVTDGEFPVQEINDLGYHCEFIGQKTHYGVAILSKTKPVSVTKGFAQDGADAQNVLSPQNLTATTVSPYIF